MAAGPGSDRPTRKGPAQQPAQQLYKPAAETLSQPSGWVGGWGGEGSGCPRPRSSDRRRENGPPEGSQPTATATACVCLGPTVARCWRACAGWRGGRMPGSCFVPWGRLSGVPWGPLQGRKDASFRDRQPRRDTSRRVVEHAAGVWRWVLQAWCARRGDQPGVSERRGDQGRVRMHTEAASSFRDNG